MGNRAIGPTGPAHSGRQEASWAGPEEEDPHQGQGLGLWEVPGLKEEVGAA